MVFSLGEREIQLLSKLNVMFWPVDQGGRGEYSLRVEVVDVEKTQSSWSLDPLSSLSVDYL